MGQAAYAQDRVEDRGQPARRPFPNPAAPAVGGNGGRLAAGSLLGPQRLAGNAAGSIPGLQSLDGNAAGSLLGLQRLAGNAAVSRLVAQRDACCSSCAGGGACEDERAGAREDAAGAHDGTARVQRDAVPGAQRDAVPGVQRDAVARVQRDAVPGVQRDAVPGVQRDAVDAPEAPATGPPQTAGEEVQAGPVLADPVVDVSPLDSVAEAAEPEPALPTEGTAAPQPAEADAAAGTPPVSACPVFTSMSGWTHSNRGAGAFAAQTGFRLTSSGSTFSASLDTATSWVNTYFVPQGTARTGRTTQVVGDCTQAFAGGAGSYTWTPAGCAAAAATAHTAGSAAECETVIGAGLDGSDQTDIPRLLRHEQYHLKLACALADKATAAVAAGTSVRTAARQLQTAATRETRAYDNATNHGCNAASQSTWESNIDGGSVTFP